MTAADSDTRTAAADRPLRILRVVHTLRGASGGPAESVRRSTETMLAQGHQVEIATLDGRGSISADEPLTVHALGNGAEAIGYASTPHLVPWLRSEKTRFDAVLVHGLWQYQGWGTHIALKGTAIPYLVFPHGMLDPWFRRTYPLKHLKKQIYWKVREGRVLAGAAAVCFTCDEERRLARDSFRPYRINERVVAYGTADSIYDPERQSAVWARSCPAAQVRPYLLFLGRLHPKKNIEALLHAHGQIAARNPFAPDLVIAGPGLETSYGQSLLQLACSICRQGTVHWPGMLENEAKWGALSGCEAFVLPSHQENFGIAVAEALACSRPVLISNQVNIWREIETDGAGLVRGDSPEDVLALLNAWMTVQPAKREEMKTAARRCFETRFHINKATESLVATVRETLCTK
ncbi:MAG: hypothetical protein RIQ79_2443 [Verrucomicrobiota bacterium]